MKPRAQHMLSIAFKMAGTLLALYLVSDAWLDREAEQFRTENLRREMDYKQRVAASHDDYAAQLKEMRGMLTRLLQRLPSNFDSSAIEKTVHDHAKLAGIEIASMHTAKERRREFYADLPVDLIAEGPALKVAEFVAVLLGDSPLQQITAMEFAPIEKQASLRVVLTTHYYRYIEEGE